MRFFTADDEIVVRGGAGGGGDGIGCDGYTDGAHCGARTCR